jgi:hypothetical protein
MIDPRFTHMHQLLVVVLFSVCAITVHAADAPLFRKVPPASSGVNYHNWRQPLNTDSGVMNRILPGAGIGVADLNGDGVLDIVAASFGGTSLYFGKGGLKYDERALADPTDLHKSWFVTGVSLADIDADGDVDIYLCRWEHANGLWLNDGKGNFTEHATDWGVDYNGECSMATFLDADHDGYLDLYLTVYSRLRESIREAQQMDTAEQRRALDRLREGISNRYYDNGDTATLNLKPVKRANLVPNPRGGAVADQFYRNIRGVAFLNATSIAEINDDGFGLNVTAADLNDDGWTDLYVNNDFNARDLYYVNDGDGTFSKYERRSMNKSPIYSMGADIVDINNDGLLDAFATDMLPNSHARRIINTGVNGDLSIYNPEYDSNQVMRNVFLLNRGDGTFADVAFLAGLEATDWSWACLFADFDNDGFKDAFVANGYIADFTNQDFVYNIDQQRMAPRDSTGAPAARRLKPLTEQDFAFKNRDGIHFTNMSTAWGFTDSTMTFGAMYADLDADGDLDLICNAVDTTLMVFENTSKRTDSTHWIDVRLEGYPVNTFALGARIWVHTGVMSQMYEISSTRGFMSSTLAPTHVGLGRTSSVDSIVVRWPDGVVTHVKGPLAVDKTVTVRYATSRDTMLTARQVQTAPPLLAPVEVMMTPPFMHMESAFDDFKYIRLMPNRRSWDGPAVAVADVNGDGRDDLWIGGASTVAAVLYTQQEDGSLVQVPQKSFDLDKAAEDVDGVFVDIDRDGDADLIVGSGSIEAAPDSSMYGIRVYRNDGTGQFTRDVDAAPYLRVRCGSLAAADADGDGDVDLFVGARIDVDRYPLSPKSHYLLNDGSGVFTDATLTHAPDVDSCGMISDAIWADLTGDGVADLITAGEWTGIQVFRNTGGVLRRDRAFGGLDTLHGWWYSLAAYDLDGDGDLDLCAGNHGLNNRYGASLVNGPIRCHAADFDENESIDPIITYMVDGKERVMRDRMSMFGQMPTLNRAFNTYAQFAAAAYQDYFPEEAQSACENLEANTFSSLVLRNEGNGSFTRFDLPWEAQVSPIWDWYFRDLDRDGRTDILTVGNAYGAEAEMVRLDAGRGLVLTQKEPWSLEPLPFARSGVSVNADMRRVVFLRRGAADQQGGLLMVVSNRSPIVAYRLQSL